MQQVTGVIGVIAEPRLYFNVFFGSVYLCASDRASAPENFIHALFFSSFFKNVIFPKTYFQFEPGEESAALCHLGGIVDDDADGKTADRRQRSEVNKKRGRRGEGDKRGEPRRREPEDSWK